jgi:phosphotransferase system enzyme I (PtsP)
MPGWSTRRARARGRAATRAGRCAGLKLVTGMARGVAVFHQPRVLIEHTVAEDTEAERHRVYSAFRKMREQIDTMTSEAEFGTAASIRRSSRPTRCSPMTRAGRGGSTRRSTAASPPKRRSSASSSAPARMREIDDPLLQERMHDLDDLSNRLLRIVSGQLGTAAQTGLPHDAILIARNLGPPSCSNMTGGG